MDQRVKGLHNWLTAVLPTLQGLKTIRSLHLEPLCGDASSRRYFRLATVEPSLIAVDTPVEASNFQGFVSLCRHWRRAGLHVPELLATDEIAGYMLLEDLGDQSFLDVLSETSADVLYGGAITALLKIQSLPDPEDYSLPPYDRALLQREVGLFQEWLLEALLGVQLSLAEQQILDQGMELLIASALEQPRVCVHRDYHSRNLMKQAGVEPGIIDFQDAVKGPLSYDLVSLLKDCYIAWPAQRRQQWLQQYADKAVSVGILSVDDLPRLPRWFDWMGAQRHFKAAGIFARLQIRDGKPGYLADIPRTLGYILELDQYPELQPMIALLKSRLVPAMQASSFFAKESVEVMA